MRTLLENLREDMSCPAMEVPRGLAKRDGLSLRSYCRYGNGDVCGVAQPGRASES